jgi:hypothetical protein
MGLLSIFQVVLSLKFIDRMPSGEVWLGVVLAGLLAGLGAAITGILTLHRPTSEHDFWEIASGVLGLMAGGWAVVINASQLLLMGVALFLGPMV